MLVSDEFGDKKLPKQIPSYRDDFCPQICRTRSEYHCRSPSGSRTISTYGENCYHFDNHDLKKFLEIDHLLFETFYFSVKLFDKLDDFLVGWIKPQSSQDYFKVLRFNSTSRVSEKIQRKKGSNDHCDFENLGINIMVVYAKIMENIADCCT